MAGRIKGITVEIGGNTTGLEKALSDILEDCRGAFGQLSESEQAAAAEALVGKNAMSGFLALMNAGEGDIEKLSTAIANCDGTAEHMAETMQDNLAGQLTILCLPCARTTCAITKHKISSCGGNGEQYVFRGGHIHNSTICENLVSKFLHSGAERFC